MEANLGWDYFYLESIILKYMKKKIKNQIKLVIKLNELLKLNKEYNLFQFYFSTAIS